MAAQNYDQCFHAILQLLSGGDIYSLQDIEQACRDYFDPAESEPGYDAEKDPQFQSKVYWSRFYLKSAGLITSKPRSGLFELTNEGKIVAKNPKQVDKKFLYRYKAFFEFQAKNTIEQFFPDKTPQDLLNLFLDAVKNGHHKLNKIQQYIQNNCSPNSSNTNTKRYKKIFYMLRDRLLATNQIQHEARKGFYISKRNSINALADLDSNDFKVPRDSELIKVLFELLQDKNEHTLDEIIDYCAKKFNLSEADLNARYEKSGELMFRKTIVWKISHMKSNGDIISTGRAKYKLSDNFDPNNYNKKNHRTSSNDLFVKKSALKVLLNKEVQTNDIENFANLLSRKGIEHGIIATNSKISQEVKNFAENIESCRIILLDKSQLDEINVEFQ